MIFICSFCDFDFFGQNQLSFDFFLIHLAENLRKWKLEKHVSSQYFYAHHSIFIWRGMTQNQLTSENDILCDNLRENCEIFFSDVCQTYDA